jgi:hypothetical protein
LRTEFGSERQEVPPHILKLVNQCEQEPNDISRTEMVKNNAGDVAKPYNLALANSNHRRAKKSNPEKSGEVLGHGNSRSRSAPSSAALNWIEFWADAL